MALTTFILTSPSRDLIWPCLRGKPTRSQATLHLELLVRKEMNFLREWPTKPGDIGPVFETIEELKARLPRPLPFGLASLDLAVAFREMGQHAEAVESAAIALASLVDLTPDQGSMIPEVIFGQAVLRGPVDAMLEQLRTLLFAN